MTSPTETPRTRVFACPAHAPAGIRNEPNDDGWETCSICGTANYAVKPFLIHSSVVERGYWVDANGQALTITRMPR